MIATLAPAWPTAIAIARPTRCCSPLPGRRGLQEKTVDFFIRPIPDLPNARTSPPFPQSFPCFFVSRQPPQSIIGKKLEPETKPLPIVQSARVASARSSGGTRRAFSSLINVVADKGAPRIGLFDPRQSRETAARSHIRKRERLRAARRWGCGPSRRAVRANIETVG